MPVARTRPAPVDPAMHGPGRAIQRPPTPPRTSARQGEVERLDRLADLLDTRYRIPLTNIRFGLDAVLGLIPGLGDFAALVPTAYMILEGRRMGASNRTLGRMTVNAALDFAVGSIPVLGSIWDVWFKANRRNMALLRHEITSRS